MFIIPEYFSSSDLRLFIELNEEGRFKFFLMAALLTGDIGMNILSEQVLPNDSRTKLIRETVLQYFSMQFWIDAMASLFFLTLTFAPFSTLQSCLLEGIYYKLYSQNQDIGPPTCK